jgi:hypothetical protein
MWNSIVQSGSGRGPDNSEDAQRLASGGGETVDACLFALRSSYQTAIEHAALIRDHGDEHWTLATKQLETVSLDAAKYCSEESTKFLQDFKTLCYLSNKILSKIYGQGLPVGGGGAKVALHQKALQAAIRAVEMSENIDYNYLVSVGFLCLKAGDIIAAGHIVSHTKDMAQRKEKFVPLIEFQWRRLHKEYLENAAKHITTFQSPTTESNRRGSMTLRYRENVSPNVAFYCELAEYITQHPEVMECDRCTIYTKRSLRSARDDDILEAGPEGTNAVQGVEASLPGHSSPSTTQMEVVMNADPIVTEAACVIPRTTRYQNKRGLPDSSSSGAVKEGDSNFSDIKEILTKLCANEEFADEDDVTSDGISTFEGLEKYLEKMVQKCSERFRLAISLDEDSASDELSLRKERDSARENLPAGCSQETNNDTLDTVDFSTIAVHIDKFAERLCLEQTSLLGASAEFERTIGSAASASAAFIRTTASLVDVSLGISGSISTNGSTDDFFSVLSVLAHCSNSIVICVHSLITAHNNDWVSVSGSLNASEELLVAECCYCYLRDTVHSSAGGSPNIIDSSKSQVMQTTCLNVLGLIVRSWCFNLAVDEWQFGSKDEPCISSIWRRVWITTLYFAHPPAVTVNSQYQFEVAQAMVAFLESRFAKEYLSSTTDALPLKLSHFGEHRESNVNESVVTTESLLLLIEDVKRICREQSLILPNTTYYGSSEWLQDVLLLSDDQVTQLARRNLGRWRECSLSSTLFEANSFVLISGLRAAAALLNWDAKRVLCSRLLGCLTTVYCSSNRSEELETWMSALVEAARPLLTGNAVDSEGALGAPPYMPCFKSLFRMLRTSASRLSRTAWNSTAQLFLIAADNQVPNLEYAKAPRKTAI